MFQFLVIAALCLAPSETDLNIAIELHRRECYEESEKSLREMSPPKDQGTYYFYRLANAVKLNNQAEAKKHLSILEDMDELPIRYRNILPLITHDMKDWKKDDLADVARDMDRVKSRLKNYKGGKETQKIQQDVVNRLSRMIKELEDAQKKGDDGAKEAEAKRKAEGKPQQAEAPQDDSKPGDDKGPGKVDIKVLEKATDNWGKLPPREREAIMRNATREMDPRYREIVMEYFKRLSRQEDYRPR